MSKELTISQKQIENKIYNIREMQVMFDSDLAELYRVETKVLNQAVKRNIERFPENFMFQLTQNELGELKSQKVTSSLRSQIVTSSSRSQVVTLKLPEILNRFLFPLKK